MNSPSATQHHYPQQNEPGAVEVGKGHRPQSLRRCFGARAPGSDSGSNAESRQIKEPADLWDLEHYLTQRRKEIDRKYDYRYSQVEFVFGRLLREKWIEEEDLRGLGEDKLRAIRSYAKFFAGTDDA
jgi:hypothetical protein